MSQQESGDTVPVKPRFRSTHSTSVSLIACSAASTMNKQKFLELPSLTSEYLRPRLCIMNQQAGRDHTTDLTMEERWGFLAPWCATLKGRFSYSPPDQEGELWNTRKRALIVSLPRRGRLDEENYELDPEEESKFKKEFQRVQEALALLSVVAHFDYDAWRYLLEEHCGLYVAQPRGDYRTFGQKTEARYGDEIPARFLLHMHLKGRTYKEDGVSFDSDLVSFCGFALHSDPSEEYVKALAEIEALDGIILETTDVKVPVRVSWGGSVQLLEHIWKAEQAIQEQWQRYSVKPQVGPGHLKCTFKLEPMSANFHHINSTEMVKLVQTLLVNKVRFSQFILQMSMDRRYSEEILENTDVAKKLFSILIGHVFSCVRRSYPLDNTSYYYDLKQDELPLQLGAVHLDCRLLNGSWNFAAMCSAMVTNQTTKNLSIKLKLKPRFAPSDPVKTQYWWKWIGYAFFSKRARAFSSLESLALMRIGSMSTEDIKGFAAVVNSEHPEEELFNSPRGFMPARDSTLKAGAPVRWQITDDGEPVPNCEPIFFNYPTNFVRTFSDDGSSTWVNVVIPGFGRCQVQRNDLQFQQVSATAASSSKLMSVQIGFVEEDGHIWDGLPGFLAAVGTSLKFLGIDYHNGALGFILQRCPNLQELTFCCGLSLFRLNFSNYDGDADPFDYDWRDTEALANALSDKNDPLSICLCRWRVRFHHLCFIQDQKKVYEPRIESDIKALLQMLQKNSNLEYLDIHVPDPYHGYVDEFRKHHLKPINRRLKGLATKNKVALLSVVMHRKLAGYWVERNAQPQTSQCNFDPFVLSKIFEFAASPVVRQVYVRKIFENGMNYLDEEEVI
ncbi:unnamed protein product [Phytophthora lilii]|uniref:Unnamed protein product n=1 Tax=Phytophthora lilii TaxID=2077276 RepID=A0A9W6WR83_9STRA|nr:unnamed protein product [Phytophthora lilii]